MVNFFAIGAPPANTALSTTTAGDTGSGATVTTVSSNRGATSYFPGLFWTVAWEAAKMFAYVGLWSGVQTLVARQLCLGDDSDECTGGGTTDPDTSKNPSSSSPSSSSSSSSSSSFSVLGMLFSFCKKGKAKKGPRLPLSSFSHREPGAPGEFEEENAAGDADAAAATAAKAKASTTTFEATPSLRAGDALTTPVHATGVGSGRGWYLLVGCYTKAKQADPFVGNSSGGVKYDDSRVGRGVSALWLDASTGLLEKVRTVSAHDDSARDGGGDPGLGGEGGGGGGGGEAVAADPSRDLGGVNPAYLALSPCFSPAKVELALGALQEKRQAAAAATTPGGHKNRVLAVAYACNEVESFGGELGTGGVTALAVEEVVMPVPLSSTSLEGSVNVSSSSKCFLQLTCLDVALSGGGSPCCAVVGRAGASLAVANYSGGNVALLRLGADGRFETSSDTTGDVAATASTETSTATTTTNVTMVQHKPLTDHALGGRQEAPHAHSVVLDTFEDTLLVCDLGTDLVHAHAFNEHAFNESSRSTLAALCPLTPAASTGSSRSSSGGGGGGVNEPPPSTSTTTTTTTTITRACSTGGSVGGSTTTKAVAAVVDTATSSTSIAARLREYLNQEQAGEERAGVNDQEEGGEQAEGLGARHLCLHPNGRLAFVVCEMASKIVALDYHPPIALGRGSSSSSSSSGRSKSSSRSSTSLPSPPPPSGKEVTTAAAASTTTALSAGVVQCQAVASSDLAAGGAGTGAASHALPGGGGGGDGGSTHCDGPGGQGACLSSHSLSQGSTPSPEDELTHGLVGGYARVGKADGKADGKAGSRPEDNVSLALADDEGLGLVGAGSLVFDDEDLAALVARSEEEVSSHGARLSPSGSSGGGSSGGGGRASREGNLFPQQFPQQGGLGLEEDVGESSSSGGSNSSPMHQVEGGGGTGFWSLVSGVTQGLALKANQARNGPQAHRRRNNSSPTTLGGGGGGEDSSDGAATATHRNRPAPAASPTTPPPSPAPGFAPGTSLKQAAEAAAAASSGVGAVERSTSIPEGEANCEDGEDEEGPLRLDQDFAAEGVSTEGSVVVVEACSAADSDEASGSSGGGGQGGSAVACLGRVRGVASMLPRKWEASQRLPSHQEGQEGQEGGGVPEFGHYNQGRWAADAVVHPSGKWLYATNRLHDSIVTFAIHADGDLHDDEHGVDVETAVDSDTASFSSSPPVPSPSNAPPPPPPPHAAASSFSSPPPPPPPPPPAPRGFLGLFGGGGGGGKAASSVTVPTACEEGGAASHTASSASSTSLASSPLSSAPSSRSGGSVLKLVGHTYCGGKTPRNFALSPDGGRFLVVAHQHSHSVSCFAVNPWSGELSLTSTFSDAPNAACVKFIS